MARRRKKDIADELPASISISPNKCKTACGRKHRTEGFCGICYAKFLKGYFLKNGELSPKEAAKQRKLAIKRAKREKNKKDKELKADKEMLKTVFDRRILTILSDQNPEYTESKGCPVHNFWVSGAECMQRLYISDKKQCKKCTEHDDKVPFLKGFVSMQLAEEQL